MSDHKLLFSLIILASFANLGWALIIYVLSFHGANWLIERISAGNARRPELVFARTPEFRKTHLRARGASLSNHY